MSTSLIEPIPDHELECTPWKALNVVVVLVLIIATTWILCCKYCCRKKKAKRAGHADNALPPSSSSQSTQVSNEQDDNTTRTSSCSSCSSGGSFIRRCDHLLDRFDENMAGTDGVEDRTQGLLVRCDYLSRELAETIVDRNGLRIRLDMMIEDLVTLQAQSNKVHTLEGELSRLSVENGRLLRDLEVEQSGRSQEKTLLKFVNDGIIYLQTKVTEVETELDTIAGAKVTHERENNEITSRANRVSLELVEKENQLQDAQNEVEKLRSDSQDVINSSEEYLTTVMAQRNHLSNVLDEMIDEDGRETHAELRMQLSAANTALAHECRAHDTARMLLQNAQEMNDETHTNSLPS